MKNNEEIEFLLKATLSTLAILLIIGILTSFGGCAKVEVPKIPEPVKTPKPQDSDAPKNICKSKINLWATWYFIPEYKSANSGHTLRNVNGSSISPKISLKSWCYCAMEGTCAIDGEVYGYIKTTSNSFGVDCSHIFPNHRAVKYSKFKKDSHKYGTGNKSNALTPFYSIACDQSKFKFGQEFYIPVSKSAENPKGIWRCDDVGGAIKGNHIDVFLGFNRNKFDWIKSKSTGTFEACLL